MDVARTRFVRKQAPIPPYALDVRGLKMSYGNTEVLRGVDLKVAPGEVVALLGPNGAGKTTTIEILEGLRCRTGGKVLVLGTDLSVGTKDGKLELAWFCSRGETIVDGRCVHC